MEYSKKKATWKGCQVGTIGGIAAAIAVKTGPVTGIPEEIASFAIAAALGALRNLLKSKLPKVFGWL